MTQEQIQYEIHYKHGAIGRHESERIAEFLRTPIAKAAEHEDLRVSGPAPALAEHGRKYNWPRPEGEGS